MKTFLEELDWTCKAVILAIAGVLTISAVAEAEQWNKGTDGYYYKDGDTTYPYERIEKTCYKDVTYQDGCCRTYTKRVPYTCYDYRRVVVADPEHGLERVTKQMLGIVGENAASERKLRERYAFSKEVQAIASTLGVDNIRLPLSQNLNYGDPELYQYPPQTGNTQYGVRTYDIETYGSTVQSLQPLVADIRAMQVEEHELEKIKEEHYQERDLARQQFSSEFKQSASALVSAAAQQQEGNRFALGAMEFALRLVEASKPAPQASVSVTETVPYQSHIPTNVLPLGSTEGWGSIVENSCNNCHDKHTGVKSKAFPNGVHLDQLATWNEQQIDKAITDVATRRMPKGKDKLARGDQATLVNYLMSLKVAKE
jgi:hypothetical protein